MNLDREDGFTLIEILVVVLIIGILTAIAIPVFLNQRQRAIDASLQSDIKQMIAAQNEYIASHKDSYGVAMAIREADTTNPSGTHNSSKLEFFVSPGNYIKTPPIIGGDNKGFCVIAWNPNSSKYKTETTGLFYSSIEGQIKDTGTCIY